MADLQRHNNVKPTISSVGSPSISTSTDVSEGIAQLGDAVRTFAISKKKDSLEEELRSLGDDVFAVTTGKEVKRVTDRISRLKSARDQGQISDTMIKIETEAILKESIDSMPAFAPEMRRHAASILGFDPTGAQIRALLDIPEENNSNTVLDRFKDNAEAISKTTGVDTDTIMKLQGQALFTKQQADLITQQAVLGNAGRKEILSATAKEADGHITDFMGDLVTLTNSGGIASPAEVKAQLQARLLGHKQALRDRYIAAGISPDSADLSRDMNIIEDQWEPLFEMTEEGSLTNILSNNAKAISNAMAIEGYNVMGDVALINSAAGQEGVKNYFLTIQKYGKKGQLDLLKANNPVLARHVETLEDSQKLAADAYKRVMGMSPAFSNTLNITESQKEETVNEMADHILYDVVKNKNMSELEKESRLAYVKGHGQKFKALGGYFQSGARSAASPEEIRFVSQTFEEEYPAMIERMAAELVADGNFKVRVENGKLVPFDPKSGISLSSGQGSQTINIPGGPGRSFETPSLALQDINVSSTTMADLARMSSFDKGIKNGWASDFKKSPQTFLDETASIINGGIDKIEAVSKDLGEAIKVFENEPTPENLEAIRNIDPALVAEIEQSIGK